MSGRGEVAALVARAISGDPAERRRRRLIALALAGCTTFLLAAVAVVMVHSDTPDYTCVADATGETICTRTPVTVLEGPWGIDWLSDNAGLAPYIAEPGLRQGVVLAALLLVFPFAVLGVQVLRLGSVAGERRLAALRLQGATTGDLRCIAAAEVSRAALIGAMAGLPAYVALWVLLGVLPPPGFRMLPTPGAAVLVAWPLVIAGVVLGARVAARRSVQVATADALGRTRRRVHPLTRRSAIAALSCVVAVLLGVVATVVLFAVAPASAALAVLMFAMPVLLVVSAIVWGPWLVVAVTGKLVRRGKPVTVLAGRRLATDPRPAGRTAGVMVAAGVVIGTSMSFLVGLVPGNRTSYPDLVFFGGGVALALAAVALGSVMAALSLLVAMTEHLLDSRRPTAALVALGASTGTVRHVVRTQLLVASVPPAIGGALAGSVVMSVLEVVNDDSVAWLALLAIVVSVALAAALALVAVVAVNRALRSAVLEAGAFDNLRTA